MAEEKTQASAKKRSARRLPTQPPLSKRRRGGVDPLWKFWERWEHEKGKVFLYGGLITVVLGVLLVGAIYLIVQQQQSISRLSEQRIMIGVPQPNGAFKSVGTETPLSMVKNYAATFANNVYNYTDETIEINYAAALAMVDQRRRNGMKQKLDGFRRAVQADGLSQLYARQSHSIERVDDGFLYTTQGTKIEYGGQIEVNRAEIEVEITLVRKPRTKSDPLGVSVIKLDEDPL